jgi:hypothetical protein
LLPDWEYRLDGQSLTLLRGRTAVLIKIKAWSASKVDTLEPVDVSLIRGGITLSGERQDEILGWESNTYNEKHPALSYHLAYRSSADILIETAWTITDDEK